VCSEHAAADRWFDVALWRRFPALWPEWTGRLVAENAFSAVVQLMHVYGLSSVAHATAIADDRSIVYRGYGIGGMECGLIWFAGRRDAGSAAPAEGRIS
jgi:hypothetical protein